MNSCKHLCCREGVEKAPKAPKKAPVPAGLTGKVSAGFRDKPENQPSKPKQKQQSLLSRRPGNARENEALNLSQPVDTRTTYNPRTQGSLQDSLGRNKLSPLITTQGRLHLKDVERATSASHQSHESSIKPSTAYSGDWANELPSLSHILQHDSEDDQNVTIDFRVDESPPRPKAQKVTNDEQHMTEKPMQVHEASADVISSQDGRTTYDIEDALVGLSDSITMQRKSPKDTEECPPPVRYRPSRFDNSEKLFLSTDSPEKHPERKETHPGSNGDPHTSELSLPVVDARTNTSEIEYGSALPDEHVRKEEVDVPIIKPGQPSWVYEFDPAFIAEYQDYVEFV